MAQTDRYININFPFRDSDKGFFLDLNRDDSNAIRADLMHLILTKKGERFYNPDFGTNLLKYLYEPNDTITHSTMKTDIKETVRKFIPNLKIDNVIVEPSEDNEYKATVRIEYTITDEVFTESDFIIINL
jgi:phage baseplate assembly protein W